MQRADQWVASVGIPSSVLTITSSTLSSVMVRGTLAGFVTETVDAARNEAASPLADGRPRYSKLARDIEIRCSGRARQRGPAAKR